MPKLSFTYQEFIKILKNNDFTRQRQVGSHEQWGAIVKGKFRLVTVKVNAKEFRGFLLNSMMNQSGLDKKIFRSA